MVRADNGRATVTLPGEIVALMVSIDGFTKAQCEELKTRKVFPCQDCGIVTSADELWHVSDVPGSCVTCGNEFFECPDCDGTHHPDDPCGN